mmetsp:Transcript_44398/g.103747  ORF Transcript_44398/g.103747 Transcript_44398/m.103747 type:complete len:226 (-) Transcript_44398:846-1523(-)
MACQASSSWKSCNNRSSPSRLPTSSMVSTRAFFNGSGKRMDSTNCCASSKITCASSFEESGCKRPKTFSSTGKTSLLHSSVKHFCMVPKGKANACGVKIPESAGSFGPRRARFRLLDPTLSLVIPSGRTHQEQPRSFLKFIFTVFTFAFRATAAGLSLSSFFACGAGRSTSVTVRLPSGLHLTSTHFSAKSCASCSEMLWSKQVAMSTLKFRALTAQCERMSGAS